MPVDDRLKAELKQVLVDRLFLGCAPGDIRDDANLFDNYQLDSVRVFEVIVGIEELYGISFADTEFNINAFKDVNAIAALVSAKRT